MIQELTRMQCLKNYKGARVELLKSEKNNYIEHLQILVYLDGIEKPIFASKLNNFEFYTTTKYKMNKKWANIPFIFDPSKEEVKKIRLKDGEDKKLRKLLSKLTYKTSRMVYDEVLGSINKLDSSKFTERPKKPQRSNVVVVNI